VSASLPLVSCCVLLYSSCSANHPPPSPPPFKISGPQHGPCFCFPQMPAKRAGSPSPPKTASAATKRADITPSTIALYVPNLIGYFRLITGIAALYYAPFNQNQNQNMTYFLALYFVSYMADALDGTAARALNQTSKFGQVALVDQKHKFFV
jgi:hypothetical protein